MRRRAFSLIELLTVIAIVALLLALVLAAGRNVKQAARAQQTVVTVENLSAMLDEYNVVHAQPLKRLETYPNVGPVDDVMDTETIFRLCDSPTSVENVRRSLDGVTINRVAGDAVDYHGSAVTLAAVAHFFIDSWERVLWYRPSVKPANWDTTLPPLPPWEPKYSKGGWVSAGADGEFGTSDDIEPGKSR